MNSVVTLYAVSTTLFTVVLSTNDSECLVQKRQCDWDGNCEDVLLPCDGCQGGQYLCPDGQCIDLDDVCLFTCPAGQKECPERQCIPENSRCCELRNYHCEYNNHKWCSRKSGHCSVCSTFQRRCPNGDCLNPGEICHSPCPSDEFECPDGTCAASEDKCWCNKECEDGLCAQRRKCRKECPKQSPYLCQTGQCVDGSDQCPKCGDGLIYCGYNHSCLDASRGEICRTCPEQDRRRCRDGSCVSERWGTCRKPCWPDEFPCPDGRCVHQLVRCECKFQCPDGTCVRYRGECAWKMDHSHTLDRLYLYIPLVIITSGALIFVCVLHHRNQMRKRNAQKRGPKVDAPRVCKSGPSHFPIPLVALDMKPRVRVTSPPPPVWQPPRDVEIEIQNPPPLQPREEATSSEQSDETSTLLTKPC